MPSLQDFDLTLLDCLNGLVRAVDLGWFHVKTFDIQAYQEYIFFTSITNLKLAD
jgi:hypothetical protein